MTFAQVAIIARRHAAAVVFLHVPARQEPRPAQRSRPWVTSTETGIAQDPAMIWTGRDLIAVDRPGTGYLRDRTRTSCDLAQIDARHWAVIAPEVRSHGVATEVGCQLSVVSGQSRA